MPFLDVLVMEPLNQSNAMLAVENVGAYCPMEMKYQTQKLRRMTSNVQISVSITISRIILIYIVYNYIILKEQRSEMRRIDILDVHIMSTLFIFLNKLHKKINNFI